MFILLPAFDIPVVDFSVRLSVSGCLNSVLQKSFAIVPAFSGVMGSAEMVLVSSVDNNKSVVNLFIFMSFWKVIGRKNMIYGLCFQIFADILYVLWSLLRQ